MLTIAAESLSDGFVDWLVALPITGAAIPFLLDACAAVVLGWVWVRRRRGNRWATWPLPAVIPILVLAALFAINGQFGYINTLGAVFDTADYATGPTSLITNQTGHYANGVVVPADIPGPTSGVGQLPAYVYLPPQYFDGTGAKFPVAYLLAGTPGEPIDWFRGGDAADAGAASAKSGHPMIIVSPTVGPTPVSDTECVNGAQGQWEDYLGVDVPNWVNSQARSIPGKAGQVIAGLSMGGYCAQMLALRHPDTFAASGNFSGFTVPTYDGGLPALFGNPPNLAATIASYSGNWLITNQPSSRPVANWLAVGEQDDPVIVTEQQSFASLAHSLGVEAVFSQIRGSHTFYTWGEFIQEWLPWAAAVLAAEAS